MGHIYRANHLSCGYVLHNSSMYGPAGVIPFRVARTT